MKTTFRSALLAAAALAAALPAWAQPSPNPPAAGQGARGPGALFDEVDAKPEVGALVIGTDHAAENVTAFFTKWGDGAADILPLAGLNKRQGAQLLEHLG